MEKGHEDLFSKLEGRNPRGHSFFCKAFDEAVFDGTPKELDRLERSNEELVDAIEAEPFFSNFPQKKVEEFIFLAVTLQVLAMNSNGMILLYACPSTEEVCINLSANSFNLEERELTLLTYIATQVCSLQLFSLPTGDTAISAFYSLGEDGKNLITSLEKYFAEKKKKDE